MSVRSRNWCFTLNNYSEDDYQRLLGTESVYIVVGKEVGESLTPHLQGFVVFKDARTLSVIKKKICSKCHWEPCKGSVDENYIYCTKDGIFEERGVKPMNSKEKGSLGGEAEKVRWKRIIEAAEAGDNEWLKENEPRVYAEGERTILSIRKRARAAPETLESMDNEWWYGPTGTGKSRKAYEENPKAFRKDPKERWWDGYEGQDVVIIDDFDKFQVSQGGDMKRWMDHYPFMAAYKGGYMEIRPKKIIVTSNYSPDQIWEDTETVDPIKRRVKLVRFGPEPVYPMFNGQVINKNL